MSRDDDDRADVLEAYRKHHRRYQTAMLLLVACVGIRIVFDHPKKWGDGEVAEGLYWVAHVAGVLSLLVAFASGFARAELRGYHRGKYGTNPDAEPNSP